MGAVTIDAMSSRADHAEALVNETMEKFRRLKGDQTVIAVPGDRLIAMSMGGDRDVLEVLLVRRSGTVARSLSGMHFEKDKKYVLPTMYNGAHPPMHGAFQVALYKQAAAEAAVEKPKRAAPQRAPAGESKLDKCKQLYADAADKDKAAIIKLFIEQGGCTEKGAVTYYYVCKKG